ncbi:MAG: M20/M25/M40 family metallo-hydrolase [Wenzhouxiangella sp.]|jgi:alkaline phosphatase isozyme conversion protein|nr:M20/M25/M40 family metallo-hydrolase [Wenzhouxiangella sp.]
MFKLHFFSNSAYFRCAIVALAVCGSLQVLASDPVDDFGALAEREIRTLAGQFPGRMGGTPQEAAAADYLVTRLRAFGYAPVVDEFPVNYRFVPEDGEDVEVRQAVSRNIVAEIKGQGEGLIIIGAHYDTAVARRPDDVALGVGGPDLEGVDDNASGVGVLLELAQRLAAYRPEPTVRFIAFGAEEVGLLGARHVVDKLTDAERESLVIMINIDSIVTGDYLYVHAGPSTLSSHPQAAAMRDQAIAIAAELGVEMRINPGLNADYPAGTGCCSDQAAFDEAGLPVINIEATNWRLGELDGFQQTDVSEAFPKGESWHSASLDRLAYLEANLPAGRIRERSAQVVSILMELLRLQADLDNGAPGLEQMTQQLL